METLTWRRENELSKDKLYDYFCLSRAIGLFARFREREKLITSEFGSSLTSSTTTSSSSSSNVISLTPTATSDSIVNSSSIDSTHVNIGNNGNNVNNNSNCASIASGSSMAKNGSLAISSEDGRKGSSLRSKQNNLQTPTKHQANEVDGEDRKIKSNTNIDTNANTNTNKKQQQQQQPPSVVTLDDELHSMTKFVSTHHPNGGIIGDQSCTFKSLDAKSEKWSLTEARLFAHALEMYGKNFCSIKKAMPWKPAKSIIEQYYKKVTINTDTGSGGGSSSSGSSSNNNTGSGGTGDHSGPSTNSSASSNFNNGQRGSGKDDGNTDDSHNVPQSPSSSTTAAILATSPNSGFDSMMIDKSDLETTYSVGEYATGHNVKSFSGNLLDAKGSNSILKSPLAIANVDDILGPEIKPVKAKPIFSAKGFDLTTNGHNGGLINSISATATTTTTNPGDRGYLQFFQNGQLVLKLKGVHEGNWVQSEDSPSLPRHDKSKKSHHYNGKKHALQVTSNDGHSSRASVVSEDMSADDGIDSTDDDSHGSSSIESRSLPSPSLGSSSLAVVANVTNSPCPPPLTRPIVPTAGGKISSIGRTNNCQPVDASGNIHNINTSSINSNNNINNKNTASNGINGGSSRRFESGFKRDSSSLTSEYECTCGESENCQCGNNITGTSNGNCKSKKLKSCNGNTSNRNVSNGSVNTLSDTSSNTPNLSGTSFNRASDSSKISGNTSNSLHRHSNNLEVTSKSNYNGNRSHFSSSSSSSTTSSIKSSQGSLAPPPLAHSSSASAVVDLSSKNGSCVQPSSQKSPSSGNKKLFNDGHDNCAVDLSVKASASTTKVLSTNSNSGYTPNSLQYPKSSSVLKSETGKVTRNQILTSHI